MYLSKSEKLVVDVGRRLTLAAALGVVAQRPPQLRRNADIVDNQAAFLVAEDAVHPRDRLHQVVIAHRFVDVHGVQARNIETSEPHVAHDHELKRIIRRFEPFLQLLLG